MIANFILQYKSKCRDKELFELITLELLKSKENLNFL